MRGAAVFFWRMLPQIHLDPAYYCRYTLNMPHLSSIVPHGTFFLLAACASVCFAEVNATDACETPILTLASANDDANSLVNLGMRDMLLGWDEQARIHFTRARQLDESPLAVLGVMLTSGANDEDRATLQKLLEDDVPMTPQELDMLGTFLRVLRGEQRGAGEEFAARAEQRRRDWLSGCWAALLLHNGYDVDGHALPGQALALEKAQALYHSHSDKPLVCYMRALVEETAPQVTNEALDAARKAADMLPSHPSPQLLLAHLLYRRGEGEWAIPPLQLAVQFAEQARQNVPHGTFKLSLASSPLEIRARLYLATLLARQGRAGESRAALEALKPALNSDVKALSVESGWPLLHWAARTLPLRLLMLRAELPSRAEVADAVKFSESFAPLGKEDLVRSYHDCLRFCVVARQCAAEGKLQQANRCIKAAEDCLAMLRKVMGDTSASPLLVTCRARAVEACTMAILAAKAAAYADTADIWLKSLEDAERPAGYLMPPVLPR